MFNFNQTPAGVKNLLIINVLVFMAQSLLPIGDKITEMFAMHPFASSQFSVVQVVTSMFMHADISHLFFNMFALWMFGSILEQEWGVKRFLLYYFVCGIGAGLLHNVVLTWEHQSLLAAADSFFANPTNVGLIDFISQYGNVSANEVFTSAFLQAPDSYPLVDEATQIVRGIVDARLNTVTLGASGAVFGLLLAYGMLYPNNYIMLMIPPVSIKAKYFVIGYGVLELLLGIASFDNVAHFAHLGGMLFGAILIIWWRKRGLLYRHDRWY